MGFRWKKQNPYFAIPRPISEEVLSETVDENGVQHSTLVVQPCSVSSATLPSIDEYKLSSLQAAGVPLTEVPLDGLIDSQLSDDKISSIVDNVTKTNDPNID